MLQKIPFFFLLSILFIRCSPEAEKTTDNNGLILATVVYENKVGFINQKGEFVITPRYGQPNIFSEGLCAWLETNPSDSLRKAQKLLYGYIDVSGKYAIKPQFEQAYSFQEGRALVKEGEKFGFIDKTGKKIIPIRYHRALSFSEGLAPVEENGKWGYIDPNGVTVIQPQFDYALPFRDGRAHISFKENENALWRSGFINRKGEIIIEPKFPLVNEYFSEGLTVAFKGESYGFIDTTGKWVFFYPYEWPKDVPLYTPSLKFKKGIAPFLGVDSTKDAKRLCWGFLDKNGKTVIKPEYEYFDATGFIHSGLICVRKNGLCGYIDATGKVVIPCEYETASGFQNGLAMVGKNKRFGFINTENEIVLPLVYSTATPFHKPNVNNSSGDADYLR